jgi:hypothetical protein
MPAVWIAMALAAGAVRAQDAREPLATPVDPAAIIRTPEPVAGDPAAAGQAPDAAEAPPTPAATDTTAALTPIARDPFWPPGFDPTPPVVDSTTPAVEPTISSGSSVRLPEPGPADWNAAARQIKPRIGRSVDPEGNEVFFALLNNRLLAIGKTISASTPLFACSWRVGRITADGVELIPVEARRLSDGKRFSPPKRETD